MTGILIPKTLSENLRWRQSLRDEAADDERMQAELLDACKQSAWFWINAFVWTFRQKHTVDGKEIPLMDYAAHVPFVTWSVQDEFIGSLTQAIAGGDTDGVGGGDVLIKKSRDMGASWLCLSVIHWHWQFVSNTTFLEASRKEEEVDSKGDMDCLFEKHRYINKHQPTWLLPKSINDKYMHLGNLDNGSSIEGESTNGDLGRGGRKTAILLDEFASVPNGDEVLAATADTAACRIFNSTPKGPGTAFHRIQTENRAKILLMPWWRHPEKGVGARQILDTDGKVRWTGPWRELQKLRRDAKTIAQEIDMDDEAAGEMFFDRGEVERHRRFHVKPPLLTGNLILPPDLGDESKRKMIARKDAAGITFVQAGKDRPWRLWIPLIDGRPPQHYTYIISADIANGSGASNSVLDATCKETGQIVGKFWSAYTSPEDLAEIAAFAGVWFGGMFSPAYLIWENNGPGGIFGRKIVRLGYPNFYCQRVDESKNNPATPRWGWNSTNQRKILLLGQYREALAKDKIINPCGQALDEALDYCFTETGELIPGKLREETGGGRQLHGDHVIADALGWMGMYELPRHRERTTRPPEGSFAHRRIQHERRLKDADEWKG